MDEVHYLADRFRGAVWEEVILQLPEHVRLVSLSATVSNAEEFGDWLVTVRGDTTVVVDEHRPVPLWQHMMVGNRLLDLFAGESAPASCTSTPSWSGTPATWTGRPWSGTAAGAAAGRAGTAAAAGVAAHPVPAAVADHRDRPAGPRRRCCRRSPSCSAGPAATPRSASACAPGCG